MAPSTEVKNDTAPAAPPPWSIERRGVDLPDAARSLPTDALILVITDDGRAAWSERNRRAAIDLAGAIRARILFYDRSAESRIADPYASGPLTADTESSHGERMLEPAELHYLGRDYLVRQIEEAAAAGVSARAWLPRGTVRNAIGEAVRRFAPDLIVVPAELRPALAGQRVAPERRREWTPLQLPVLVSGADGSLWEWQFASELSRVQFIARQFGLLSVRGRFSDFEVRLEFDEERPEATRVEARILASSLSTGLGIRDRDLRGPSFFDVQRHPYLIFRSSKVTGAGNDYTIEGELEIKGRRKEVELHGEFHGVGVARGYRRATMSATAAIDRRDWGLTGGLLIDDRVTIAIDAAAVRAAAADIEQPPSPQSRGAA